MYHERVRTAGSRETACLKGKTGGKRVLFFQVWIPTPRPEPAAAGREREMQKSEAKPGTPWFRRGRWWAEKKHTPLPRLFFFLMKSILIFSWCDKSQFLLLDPARGSPAAIHTCTEIYSRRKVAEGLPFFLGVGKCSWGPETMMSTWHMSSPVLTAPWTHGDGHTPPARPGHR